MKIRENGQYSIIGVIEVVNRNSMKIIIRNENWDKLYLQIPKDKCNFTCIYKFRCDGDWKYDNDMPIFTEELNQIIKASIVKKIKRS